MRSAFIVLAAFISGAAYAASPGGVAITAENGMQKVLAPGYELLITGDGCPAGLKVYLPEEEPNRASSFFKSGTSSKSEVLLGGERGAYFYQDGVVQLVPVQVTEGGLTAQGGKASIHYEFKPNEMDWNLTNKTDRAMQFFIVLDRTVNAVMSDKGQVEKTPAMQLWTDTTWFQGKRKLHILGGDRIWGPKEMIGQDARKGHFQVWEATLQPKESRKVVLTPSSATDDELVVVNGLAPETPYRADPIKPMVALTPAIEGELRVFSPHEYQVFQRQTHKHGSLLLAGEVKPGFEKLEYRVTGTSIDGTLPGDWHVLPLDPVTHGFNEVVQTPAGGWYRVDLRGYKEGKEAAVAGLAHVGIGEVFVIAGQSNSSNGGTEKTKPASGMVSNFSGAEWRLADDPQLGANDTTAGGSPWPTFGDALYAKYRVPIAVAVTGRGGASVVEWRPGSSNFVWLVQRIQQLHRGGFRAVLWQQGESDTILSDEAYFKDLSSIITASNAAAGWGFPWYVAQTSYTGLKSPSSEMPRRAQQRLWMEHLAMEGPDTDMLTGDNRSGLHFNAKGLKSLGELWAEKVAASLDPELAK